MQEQPRQAPTSQESTLLLLERNRKEQEAKQVLEQESQNIYGHQLFSIFSREATSHVNLRTQPYQQNSKSNLRKIKRVLVSYSSQRINQVSKRLAMPRNPLDKENKFKGAMERKMTGKTKQEEKYKLILPTIKTLKTQELKQEAATENTTKMVQRWIQKRAKPSRIEQLIQKLQVIKKSNQKRSIQRLPFIFIQSIGNESK